MSDSASFATAAQLTCPECSRAFPADVWLIVHADERPDLIDEIRAGSIHDVPCPHCADVGQVDVPLLLIRPAGDPPLMFSSAQNTSAEEDQEQASDLIGIARERMGAAWQESWLANGLRGVPRHLLAIELSDDPEAAMVEMAANAAAEMARLEQEDPEAARQLRAAAEQAMPAIVEALREFIDAESWDESQQIVEKNPELLGGEGEAMLTQLATAAHEQGDDHSASVFEEHRTLLRRCRETGIAEAFAEKIETTSDAAPEDGVPEEMRPLLAAMAALPVEQQQALAEIFAGADSAEDLEGAFASHPELLALLEQALSNTSGPTL